MAFSTHDIVPDSPTNTFAVCNKLAASNDVILSNGNLTFSRGGSSSGWRLAPVSIVLTEGKYYCEFAVTGSSIGANHSGVGTIDPDDISNYGGFSAGTVRFLDDGGIRDSTGTLYQGSAFSSGTVIGLMFDIDANGSTCDYYRDGTFKYQVTGLLPKILITGLPWHNSNLPDYHFNFGQDSSFGGAKTSGSANAPDANGIGSFYYNPTAIDSEALALCTSNLPDPAIDPATDDLPEDYFKAVTYTGDSNDNHSISTVGFQPDLIWIKNRSAAGQHVLIDSVRGDDRELFSSKTNAEQNPLTTNHVPALRSIDSTGFTLSDNINPTGSTNSSPDTFVAWCWKAGGSPSGSNIYMKDGTGYTNSTSDKATVFGSASNYTITPTSASIGTKQGSSIVKYVGNSSEDTNFTIPHGLSEQPDFILFKNLDWAANTAGLAWPAQMPKVPAYLEGMDDTRGSSSWDYTHIYGSTHADSEKVTVRAPTASSEGNRFRVWGNYNYIMYCWHSVEGFSKFGSYTGNGSADGPFVYCGFRPAFVICKCSSDTTTTNTSWAMYDNARDSSNVMNKVLYANDSINEGYRGDASTAATDIYIDFLSNGFKVRSTKEEVNDDGETYIFMAFSEQPFKYSNAR